MAIADEELASAATRGDERAFETLFVRYYPALLRYVTHLIADRPTSEDIVQEVFVRFLRQRSYRPERAFRPWLYAVATNAVRDHIRERARRAPPEALDEERQAVMPDPSDIISGQMTRARVGALLLRLPLEYRETIALRLGADMALEAIAEILGVPVGTVKSRLSIGLRQLRALLVAAGIGQGR